ncbi:MAG: molecular chaperone TorD family protein [Coriobacteriaceae bacterium]|jgi:TorA maturation chaperone TorD|nr:molecular chaperone TorD family protein [Coriobacteriaceae bacterium]
MTGTGKVLASQEAADKDSGKQDPLFRSAADDGLARLLQQREATYDLLSRLYREKVDEALISQMKSSRYPANTGNADIDKGYQLIVTYLSNLWEDSLPELSVDYTRTFIGYGVDAYSAAYPFESVHTSQRRLMMQAARDEVLALYRAAGFNKSAGWAEAEDHVSVELEFMARLCERALAAWEKGEEAQAFEALVVQHSFLADHLLPWTPMMTIEMRRFSKTDFYQGLAWLTDGFLKADLEFLDDFLGEG